MEKDKQLSGINSEIKFLKGVGEIRARKLSGWG
jgi:hypothetical protein